MDTTATAQRTCDFDTCDRPHAAKGLCDGHWRQRRDGKELRHISKQGLPLAERIEERRVVTESGCWVTNVQSGRGYSVMYHEGRTQSVHRLAYELWVGPIEPGMVIHHVCANRACHRPDHLAAVTAKANGAEMLERRSYEARIAEQDARIAELEAEVAALRSGGLEAHIC